MEMSVQIESSEFRSHERGRRRRDRSSQTVDIIVNAAAEVFSVKDFDKTQMTEVAEKAGVTKALVHYYFGTKDNLWRVAIAKVFDKCHKSFSELERQRFGIKESHFMRLLFIEYMAFIERCPALDRLITFGSLDSDERSTWVLDNHFAPLHSTISIHIERAQKIGYFRENRPNYLVAMLHGSISAFLSEFLVRRSAQDGLVSESQASHEFIDCIFSMMLEQR